MEEQKPEQEPVVPVRGPRPSVTPDPPVSGPLASLEKWLYDVLVAKAPYQLPKGLTDWIVRYGPWITLILGILLALAVIPGLMAAMAVTSYTAAVLGSAYVAAVGPAFYLALIILALQLVIMFMSVPMLLKRQRKGWQLVFYANIVSFVYGVVNTFSYGYFNLGGLLLSLISAAIGFYFVFQIRSYYKS